METMETQNQMMKINQTHQMMKITHQAISTKVVDQDHQEQKDHIEEDQPEFLITMEME